MFAVELTPESIIEFYQEAQVLNDLKHEQVVTCLGITIIPPAIGVLMEYCPNGSLFDFLYKKKNIHAMSEPRDSDSSVLGLRMSIFKSRLSLRQSEEELRQSDAKSHRMTESDYSDIQFEMLLDAARGVAYMHSRGYMHCDIKSPNFLVTEQFRLKLSDLGESRSVDGPFKSSRPPRPAINWCPPEVLEPGALAESYTPASDVFSLAMVMSEILLKQLPLESIASKWDFDLWRRSIVQDNIRPILPARVPTTIADAIGKAWQSDPTLRIESSTLVQILEDALKARGIE